MLDEQIVTATERLPSPGHILTAARIAKDFSQNDVAVKLRLSVEVVKSIENDEYEGIAPIYFRGYLRGYANLVDVDPTEVSTAFHALDLPEHPITQFINSTAFPVFEQRPLRARMISKVLGSFLAFFLVLLFTYLAAHHFSLLQTKDLSVTSISLPQTNKASLLVPAPTRKISNQQSAEPSKSTLLSQSGGSGVQANTITSLAPNYKLVPLDAKTS